MTDYKLWPATNGPNTESADDAVTAGLQWGTTRDDLFLKGYRYYRGTSAVRGTDVATWDHDSTSLISDSTTAFEEPTTTGWQEILLDAPYPAVASGVKYVTGVLFTDLSDTAHSHYTATTSYWTSGAGADGIGDGNLSAPDIDGSAGGQGKFAAGSTLARPATNANGINFWVEPILSTDDGSGGGGGEEETAGTISAQLYGSAFGDALAGRINWLSGTIKATLHTSSMTPDLMTHNRVDDLTAEVATGHGYTQGTGQTLTSKTAVFTPAASLSARANSTPYVVGDLVRPASANGYAYRCLTAGTSASSAPSWPTGNLAQVTDGGVTWSQFGKGVTVLSCANIAFGGIPGSAQYMVISDRTDPDAADQPLILLVTFEADESGTTTFTYQPPASGMVHLPVF